MRILRPHLRGSVPWLPHAAAGTPAGESAAHAAGGAVRRFSSWSCLYVVLNACLYSCSPLYTIRDRISRARGAAARKSIFARNVPAPREVRGGEPPYFRSEGLPSPKTPPFTGTVRGCAPWKPCFFKFTSKIDFRGGYHVKPMPAPSVWYGVWKLNESKL